MADYKCDGEIIVETITGPASAAIIVRNAYKVYGTKRSGQIVLDGLNMTVVKGSIYGLLGASGCGKTSLLSCVVGRRQLDRGEIWVLGGKPGSRESGVPGRRVGYMPQEIALYPEFSISEMMRFFGLIYGMSKAEIEQRMNYLITFLELPDQHRQVQHLSGGQQRRLSFATALLHTPELLILDEPTVGVDPVLRAKIWDHITNLTKTKNTTIILTTHYIEEAKRSNYIGLMRGGVLLAEGSPDTMMAAYNTDNLEDIFLMLSLKQGPTLSEVDFRRQPGIKQLCKDSEHRVISLPSSKAVGYPSAPAYKKINGLVRKNVLRMLRQWGVLLMILSIPIAKITIFCITIGKDPEGLRMGIANEEIGDEDCYYEDGCSMANMSCRYLTYISKKIKQIDYDTMQEAVRHVKKGYLLGAVLFQPNFTQSIIERFTVNATDVALETSDIVIRMDMTNRIETQFVWNEFQTSFDDFIRDLLNDCYMEPRKARFPLQITKPVYGKKDTPYSYFMVPGFLVNGIFLLSMALTSMGLITEKRNGMYDRTLIAGVTTVQMIFSQLMTQFLITLVQTSIEFFIVIILFGMNSEGPIPVALTITISTGIAGLCLGFVISAICATERDALQASLGIFYPLIFLSGTIWPIQGMPLALQHFTNFLPLTRATTAMRAVYNRGWNLERREVYIGLVALYVWSIVFLCVAYVLLKLKQYGIV